MTDVEYDPQQEVVALDAAIAANADDFELYLARADACISLGDYGRAEADLETAQKLLQRSDLHPAHRWGWRGAIAYRKAEIHSARHKPDLALAAMKEAARRAGEEGDACYEAGKMAFDLGRFDEAGELWLDWTFTDGAYRDELREFCLQLESAGKTYPWLPTLLGRIFYAHSADTPANKAKAVEYLKRGCQAPAHRGLAYRTLGLYELTAQRYAQAAQYFAKSLKHLRNPRVLRWWLYCQAHLGHLEHLPNTTLYHDWNSAIQYYETGVEFYEDGTGADDSSKRLLRQLAQASYEYGLQRFEHYFKTGEGSRGDSDAHTYSMLCRNLALCYQLNGRYQEGLALHDKGLAVSSFYEHWYGRFECAKGLADAAEIVLSARPLTRVYRMYDVADTPRHFLSLALNQESLKDWPELLITAHEAHDFGQMAHARDELDDDGRDRLAATLATGCIAAAQLKNPQQLDDLAEQALGLSRQSVLCHRQLAEAYDALKNSAKSRMYLDLGIKLCDDNAVRDSHFEALLLRRAKLAFDNLWYAEASQLWWRAYENRTVEFDVLAKGFYAAVKARLWAQAEDWQRVGLKWRKDGYTLSTEGQQQFDSAVRELAAHAK